MAIQRVFQVPRTKEANSSELSDNAPGIRFCKILSYSFDATKWTGNMKTLISSVVILILFYQGKVAKDFEILRSEILPVTDTISQKRFYVLDFNAKVNPHSVTRFAFIERKTEKVLYVYNIVEQEDGFYCEGNTSYRKIFDGNISARLQFTDALRLNDIELVYFMGTQMKKLRL